MVRGSIGGTTYASILVSPSTVAPLLPKVDKLPDHEARVLYCYKAIKGGPYRRSELERVARKHPDQDIDRALPPRSNLTTEWREDLLGGVTVIEGSFANGEPMLAIPNFARYNREEGTFAPRRPEPNPDGSRPEPFPPTSIVWIREA